MRIAALLALVLAGSGLALRAFAERLERPVLTSPDVITISGGFFDMGSDDADIAFALELCAASSDERANCRPELFFDELPRHRVYVGAYRIDREEVSRADYQRCVEHDVCTPPRVADLDTRLSEPQHPVAGVTQADAQRYCAWVGGRLPTEAEWERAARGNGQRRFPWGRHFNDRVANHAAFGAGGEARDGYEYAAPVDAYPDGASAYGLLNMAGNVWELTADRYDRAYYERSESVDPQGPTTGDEVALRGGSWRSPAYTLRVTQRAAMPRNEARPDAGFRCAYNVP